MNQKNNIVVQLQGATIQQEDLSEVLLDVNLTITQGEFCYLIGKTGSGKSSLLKTLYGALPLQKGMGKVSDFDLLQLNRKTIPFLRRKLGIVFQDFNLLTDRTVGENLRFVLSATGWEKEVDIQNRMAEVLKAVGLPDAATRMPNQLSGGEQQRIVIARALLNRPQLLIADEPTGNLDPETSDDILNLMRQLAKEQNTAVLFATHDYRILQNFPARIIRVQHKRILEEDNFLV